MTRRLRSSSARRFAPSPDCMAATASRWQPNYCAAPRIPAYCATAWTRPRPLAASRSMRRSGSATFAPLCHRGLDRLLRWRTTGGHTHRRRASESSTPNAPRASYCPQTASRNPAAQRKRTRFDPHEGIDDNAQALFEALRHHRMKLARDENVPPYVIASDRTLRDIALLRPIASKSSSWHTASARPRPRSMATGRSSSGRQIHPLALSATTNSFGAIAMEKIRWGIIGCGDVTEVKSDPPSTKRRTPNWSRLCAAMPTRPEPTLPATMCRAGMPTLMR